MACFYCGGVVRHRQQYSDSGAAWKLTLYAYCLVSSMRDQIDALTNKAAYRQGTLMTILIAVSVTMFTIYGTRRLPFFEGCILFFDIIGVFAIVIPLWTLAPMAPSKEVWLDFGSYGGWKNLGLACLIGQMPSGGALIGADGES